MYKWVRRIGLHKRFGSAPPCSSFTLPFALGFRNCSCSFSRGWCSSGCCFPTASAPTLAYRRMSLGIVWLHGLTVRLLMEITTATGQDRTTELEHRCTPTYIHHHGRHLELLKFEWLLNVSDFLVLTVISGMSPSCRNVKKLRMVQRPFNPMSHHGPTGHDHLQPPRSPPLCLLFSFFTTLPISLTTCPATPD